jgi:hypothetical protein
MQLEAKKKKRLTHAMHRMKINQQWKWGIDPDLPSMIYVYA